MKVWGAGGSGTYEVGRSGTYGGGVRRSGTYGGEVRRCGTYEGWVGPGTYERGEIRCISTGGDPVHLKVGMGGDQVHMKGVEIRYI